MTIGAVVLGLFGAGHTSAMVEHPSDAITLLTGFLTPASGIACLLIAFTPYNSYQRLSVFYRVQKLKKGHFMKNLLAIIIIAIASIVMTGCEEQSKSDTPKTRLLADANYRLKKQLEQLKEELANQKQLLTKCQEEKIALKKQSNESVELVVTELLPQLEQGKVQLQHENQQLKSQIEKLHDEIKLLKGRLAR